MVNILYTIVHNSSLFLILTITSGFVIITMMPVVLRPTCQAKSGSFQERISFISVSVCIYIYIYTHIYTHTHTHTYIHI